MNVHASQLRIGQLIDIEPHDIHYTDGSTLPVGREVHAAEVTGEPDIHGSLAVIAYGHVLGPGPCGAVVYDTDAYVNVLNGDAS